MLIRPSDLHPGNIVFAKPELHQYDTDLSSFLGNPRISDVVASYGHPLTAQVPKYLVLPASYRSPVQDPSTCQIKLVDFGGACFVGQQAQNRCSLIFRAPEAILGSEWDQRADIWSLGCTV